MSVPLATQHKLVHTVSLQKYLLYLKQSPKIYLSILSRLLDLRGKKSPEAEFTRASATTSHANVAAPEDLDTEAGMHLQ